MHRIKSLGLPHKICPPLFSPDANSGVSTPILTTRQKIYSECVPARLFPRSPPNQEGAAATIDSELNQVITAWERSLNVSPEPPDEREGGGVRPLRWTVTPVKLCFMIANER